MVKFLAMNIKWDVDDNELEQVGELPTQMEVQLGDNDVEDWDDASEVGDVLSDRISDISGFCHDGFAWMRLDNPSTTNMHFA